MSNGDNGTADPDSSSAVERLQDEHTKKELKEFAREADLKVSGTKAEIAQRLVDADAVGVGETDEGETADAAEDSPADEGEEASGDDAADEESESENADPEFGELAPDSLDEQLDEVEVALEAAETEADLDGVEATLDALSAAVEALPDPDEDDEDDEDPKGDLQARVEELRANLEEQRGPYASDVVEAVEAAQSTLTDSEWTENGEGEAVAAVEAFVEAVNEALETDVTVGDDADPAGAAETLEAVVDTVEERDLDPDDDAETLEALVGAVETLEDDLEAAEIWDDLTIEQKLTAMGFYDVLDSKNRKDYPPELSVVRIAESERDPGPILTALEYFTSDFMEENCMMALKRLGAPEAFDEMHQRAQKRKELPIQVLGKIGDERALETLHPFVEGDSNPTLQRVVLKTIGEIGSEESTQHVADRLVAEEDEVRSAAARALGRIGDTRAVGPLTDILADDEDDGVRASAAWALVQIGTEDSLEAAVEYVDDRSYIVSVEAEKAQAALEGDATAAAA